MSNDRLDQLRTMLTFTTNTAGGDTRTNIGGNEIQKKIESVFGEVVNRSTNLLPLMTVKNQPMGGAVVWNIRTNLGSTSKVAYYADGAASTPYPDTVAQQFAPFSRIR